MKKILFGFLAMLAMLSVTSCSSDELADANWETFTAPNDTVAEWTGGSEKLDDVGTDDEGTRLIGAARGTITDVNSYSAFNIQTKDGYLVGYTAIDGIPLTDGDTAVVSEEGTFLFLDVEDTLAVADPALAIDNVFAIVNFYNADDTEKTTPIGTFKLVL